jgi:DNA-binding CsgD family transcriptional regulator
MKIAGLIRQGKTTKEMASVLNLSSRTVETHRKNIRKKLGLRDRKANLRTKLLSLQ